MDRDFEKLAERTTGLSPKIRNALKSLLSGSLESSLTELSYLKVSWTEDEIYGLYEGLSFLYCTNSQGISEDSDNSNKEYVSSTDNKTILTAKLEDRIDHLLSCLQPVSDHSLRGNIRFLKNESSH